MGAQPLELLDRAVGTTVTVRLKSGTVFAGSLGGYDQHMNLVLEPAEGSDFEQATAVEDTTIIRGDNVVSITP